MSQGIFGGELFGLLLPVNDWPWSVFAERGNTLILTVVECFDFSCNGIPCCMDTSTNMLEHGSLVGLALKERDFFCWLSSWDNYTYAVFTFNTAS